MSSPATTDPRHLVSQTVAQLHRLLDQISDAPLLSMAPEETAATLEEITRLSSRVSALELKVVAHAEDIQADQAVGATSTASW